MRKHRNEMIRFANSEYGTEVWVKHENSNEKWKKVRYPNWYDDYHYVLDDEYAELRKKSIDTGRKIQVLNSITHEWETPFIELEFGVGIENYRLEPEQEFEYPIYKKDKNSSLVIKFTELRKGKVVVEGILVYSVGTILDDWSPHTDTSVWEDIDFIEPIYYYQWKRYIDIGNIEISNFVTDEYAENNEYSLEGWVKIENSKRTWED